jgi:hypothetical protein
MKRLTIMMRVDDTARADIALTEDRTYYRFATDSSIEDGELAAIDNFEDTLQQLLAAAEARQGERPLPDDMRVQIFIDNRISSNDVSEQSLARLIDCLTPLAAEFAFVSGFKM